MTMITTDGNVQEFSPANKAYVVVVRYARGGQTVVDWFESDQRHVAVAMYDGMVQHMHKIHEGNTLHAWDVRMWQNLGKHWAVTVNLGRIVGIEPLDSVAILGRHHDPLYLHD